MTANVSPTRRFIKLSEFRWLSYHLHLNNRKLWYNHFLHVFDARLKASLLSKPLIWKITIVFFHHSRFLLGEYFLDCSHSVHESCIDKVTSECLPDLSTLSPFSTDLTTLVKGSRRNSTNHSYGPPYLLEMCINELEARGLMAEGIYRICGCVEDIEKLKTTFEQGTLFNLCVHIISWNHG